MGLLVHETIVTILELIAGCSVAAVISGSYHSVCEGAAYSDAKKSNNVFVCKNAD